LLKTLSEQKARQLMTDDLRKLQTDIAKAVKDIKKKDEATAKAETMLAEFVWTRSLRPGIAGVIGGLGAVVESRGLKTGASTALQSEWTIEDDPGLAPLKGALTKSP